MYHTNYNPVLGFILIILGMIGFLFFMSDLLFKFLGALMAIGLINYGLYLRGLPPLQFYARSYYTMFKYLDFFRK